MHKVNPKKWLGQHFLNNAQLASEITDYLSPQNVNVLEIGPGMGVLTQFLLKKNIRLKLCEIDSESVVFLKKNFNIDESVIVDKDFLKQDLTEFFDEPFSIIGNFPYNISSQILFKVIENKEHVLEVVGMFQKEVAERICAHKSNRTYGILSVLVQAFYNVEYLITVEPHEFTPPPKIKSAVIKLTRKTDYTLQCDQKLFVSIVKKAFNQRRKKLSNALKELRFSDSVPDEIFHRRAENLSVEDYVMLSNALIIQ